MPRQTKQDKEAAQIHAMFLDAAAPLGGQLHTAIKAIGPIPFSASQETPLAERLCRSVAGQQLSVKAARTIWDRVVASCEAQRNLIDHLASCAPEELRVCGLSGSKAKAMRAIAEAAKAGELHAHDLAPLHHTERAAHLTSIRGIGPWTADMINMFYFGDPDIWPDGDVAARKTLTRLTSARRKTVRTAERFAPYRSSLALYMWRYVDAPPM